MLKENLAKVEENVRTACKVCGKEREEVTLIAVSKTKPVSMLQEIYEQGVRDFGENKAQEICEKCDKLPSDIRWHMIGHLQRNKVKSIIDKVCLIHSLDSYRLAEEICGVIGREMGKPVPREAVGHLAIHMERLRL